MGTEETASCIMNGHPPVQSTFHRMIPENTDVHGTVFGEITDVCTCCDVGVVRSINLPGDDVICTKFSTKPQKYHRLPVVILSRDKHFGARAPAQHSSRHGGKHDGRYSQGYVRTVRRLKRPKSRSKRADKTDSNSVRQLETSAVYF